MTMEELKAVFDTVSYYYDKDHPEYIAREKLQALPVPFVEFDMETQVFAADDIVYHTWEQLEVRLYTDTGCRDRSERTVQAALTAAGLFWKKEPDFLPELELWQTTYTAQV